jgi:predicted SprT family Zn-dependent metalloprotease
MATHKVYGYCNKCKQKIISVTKDDLVNNKDTIYYCEKCDSYTTFNFKVTKELKKIVANLKSLIIKAEKKE